MQKAIILVALIPLLAACAPANIPTAVPTEIASATLTSTLTPSPTASVTPSPTQTETPLPTIAPTYAVLRGEVLEQANCRYGPGFPYLYKYGLVRGSNLEVIGRNDLGTWILVQAIGGDNPCWVKASLMDVKGNVMSVAPTYIPLPRSPYYGPPTGAYATWYRNVVTISWYGIDLKPGDDSEQFPYLVEAWVCADGQIIFTPVGSYETVVAIADEAGCSEPSHARLYAVEKHGYSQPVEISWPAPPTPTP